MTCQSKPESCIVTHGIGLSHFHLLSSASGSSDRISFPSLGHNNQRALGFIAWNVLELQAPHTIGSRKTARVILLAPPASRLVFASPCMNYLLWPRWCGYTKGEDCGALTVYSADF